MFTGINCKKFSCGALSRPVPACGGTEFSPAPAAPGSLAAPTPSARGRCFCRFLPPGPDTTTNFGGIYFHVFGVMLVEAFSVRTSPQTFLGLGKGRWGESSELAAWFPVGAHTRGTLKRPEILSILSLSLAQSAPASQDEAGLRSASGECRRPDGPSL